MTYRVNFEREVYVKWPEFRTTSFGRIGLVPWIGEMHPEIIDTEYTYWYGSNQRGWTFTFQSEEHYHWFLLKR